MSRKRTDIKPIACSKQRKQVNATVCTPATPPCIMDFAWTHGPGLISVQHCPAPKGPHALWQAVDVRAASAHGLDSHWPISAADDGNRVCAQNELRAKLFGAILVASDKIEGLKTCQNRNSPCMGLCGLVFEVMQTAVAQLYSYGYAVSVGSDSAAIN
jgi:hypothetical protein